MSDAADTRPATVAHEQETHTWAETVSAMYHAGLRMIGAEEAPKYLEPKTLDLAKMLHDLEAKNGAGGIHGEYWKQHGEYMKLSDVGPLQRMKQIPACHDDSLSKVLPSPKDFDACLKAIAMEAKKAGSDKR